MPGRRRWQDVERARPHPQEFRDDVVAVACQGEAPMAEVAKDFGISESRLGNWPAKADVEDGHRPGLTGVESAEALAA